MLRFKIDIPFQLLLGAPIPFWLVLFWHHTIEADLKLVPLIIMAIMFPLAEETLFRGIVQPNIAKKFSRSFFNLSVANIITSGIFAITHLINHDLLWAIGTFLPSLAFGFCQDRYKTLQAPMALHCYYNAGYFLIAGL